METITIPLDEYNNLIKIKTDLYASHKKYRQSDSWKESNRAAQRRYQQRKKAERENNK